MSSAVARVRVTRSALLAVGFLALCVSPVALASPWLSVLFLLPIAIGAYVLRAGVDVDADGITVRAMLGARRVGWGEVAGLALGRRGDVRLALRNGRSVRLPVVRTRHLPMLATASGGHLPAP